MISAWLRRRDADASFRLDGPARGIFARKLPALPEQEEPTGAFDLVLCGSSVSSTLERDAVAEARAAGVRCAVWLDHWMNYPARFDALPDELWVCDEHAERIARETVPGPPVIVRGNPYVEDAAAEIRALETPRTGRSVLYVTEPTSVAAERATGDPLGWGYEERAALRGYLAARPGPLRLRTHPAEPEGKYADIVAEHGLELSAGRSLAQDIAWADTVVGCDTMAMAVALAAGRRVVSAIPPGGRPLTLPFTEIERLFVASSGA
ncbi:hypothetical protein C8N24_2192 [Solirubrobacter pauli]|uniref:CDP-glycerol:poly(Glycerophosphate) glycerophosphotransferase n=1 Tax=Solirubrobacter pauli TaxID=166793 RepID=A0A660LDK6_9ACTN|nr:hypothetical protein [Solirubrobacter pauli]RKQ92346.1 hypothetical protein C8N24_2192 [Solirubrobacter pauli]